MRKLDALAFAAALLLISGLSPARAESDNRQGAVPQSSGRIAGRQPLSQEDREFLNYAAQDNQAEIQLCLLAEKQSRSPAVKAFARLMVNDHVAIESRLAAVLDGLNLRVSNGVGEDGQRTLEDLEPLWGAQFDREFMRAQIKDHADDIDRFNDEIGSTENGAVRSFASETVDILGQHRELAKAVEAQANGEAAAR